MKIRTGDTVVIISGKDKGKTGTVLRVLPEQRRVIVSDANMRTRHVPKNPNRAGQIVRYEASLAVSKVMLVDSKTGKRTRVGYHFDEKGKKQRMAKKSKQTVTTAKVQPAKKKPVSDTESKKAPPAQTKGPFWKKLGFGATEMAERSEVEGPTRMEVDHTVPDQLERQTGRSHSRGS